MTNTERDNKILAMENILNLQKNNLYVWTLNIVISVAAALTPILVLFTNDNRYYLALIAWPIAMYFSKRCGKRHDKLQAALDKLWKEAGFDD